MTTPDIQQQLVGVLAIVVGALIPVVRSWALSKFTPQRLASIHQLAAIAVRAAEKIGENVDAVSSGDKLTVATNMLVDSAKKLGFKLSADEVTGFVHAALREMEQVEGTHPTVVAAA